MTGPSPILADDLLAGPRGRRLLLELLMAAEPGGPLTEAIYRAAHTLEPEDGGSVLLTRSDAALRESAGAVPSPPSDTQAETADVARALGRAEAPPLTDDRLRQALADSVSAARYWQQPDGFDLLTATAPVRAALAPLAEQVAASSAASWWTRPMDPTDQWAVRRHDADASPAPDAGPPWAPDVDLPAVLTAERDRRLEIARARHSAGPTDVTDPISDEWWSDPTFAVPRSTGALADGSPAGLWFVEDDGGQERAAAFRVVPPSNARVLEVDGPAAWAELCRRDPLEVTAQVRHDWYRVTGRDGRWLIPDWAEVAREYDAVHLTAAAYLAAAGTVIPVTSGVAPAAAMIAGWNPDETVWLTAAPAQVGAPTSWRLDAETDPPAWIRERAD